MFKSSVYFQFKSSIVSLFLNICIAADYVSTYNYTLMRATECVVSGAPRLYIQGFTNQPVTIYNYTNSKWNIK